MADTKTAEHQWHKITFTPVHVLVDGEGEPVVVVDPDQADESEELSQYGCLCCDEGLTAATVNEPCQGRSHE